MHVQRLVRGNRPRRRRPDHRVDRAVRQRSRARTRARASRARRRPSSGKPTSIAMSTRSSYSTSASASALLAVEAPVDRLQAAIQVALLQQLAERADLVGLVAKVHRRVRMVPVAQHAEPLEVLLLPLDLLGRVGAAQPLRFRGRQVLAVRLLDLHLDRHAVAIPARHVRRVEARQRAALDDRVLQDLVDGVADVDVAVRVRRAVVQDEARAARATRRGSPRRRDCVLPRLDPAGSRCARSPRIGNGVSGRFSVGL